MPPTPIFRLIVDDESEKGDEGVKVIKDCAVEAGFGKCKDDQVSIIQELEAAALTALYLYGDKFQGANTLKVNTNVMIVDMGGGTVDLIIYMIKQLKPLKVEEVCVGSSAKYGLSAIDRQFLKFMWQWFGTEFISKSEKMIGPKGHFINEFEDIKRRFDNRTAIEGLRLQMNWEDLEQYDPEDGEIILQREDIVEMFKPVIVNVTGLIQGQIDSTAKENSLPVTAIILCGGLAESDYIQTELKDWCAKNTPNAEVLVPTNPWSAICVGAAMSKRATVIKSRRARRSYGTVTYVPFNPSEHDEANAVSLPNLGKRMEKMHWHVRRNDPLQANEKYRWLKKATIQVERDTSVKGKIELFESDTTVAPTWRFDKGIQKLGDLSIDLSDSQASPIKKRKRGSNSLVPNAVQRTERQKIEVGQVILPRQNCVEFIARIGRKRVGRASFEYTPKTGEDGYGYHRGGDGDEDEDDNPDFWLHRPFQDYNPVDSFEDDEDTDDADD